MRFLITLLLTLSFTAHAACPAFKMVQGGELVPCNGVFLNQETNELVKKDLRDNELRKKQLTLKDLQIKQITVDRNNWKGEATKQAEVSHSKDNDIWKGFFGGLGLTLLVMFATGQASK